MPVKMEISPLKSEEIQSLSQLQPEGWLDIRPVFTTHIGKDYFMAYKGEINGYLVSVGHIMICGQVAWLGNVIVHPSYRGKGLGTEMTQFLVNSIYSHGIQSIYLLATSLGRPVYDKLGFHLHSHFLFSDIEIGANPLNVNASIRLADEKDLKNIGDLDYKAMGYDRSRILKHFLSDAWVYEDDNIKGFYISSLGDGLIIADDPQAGWALSLLRVVQGKRYLVVPELHHARLIDQYGKNGLRLVKKKRIAYFMYLGMTPSYNPDVVYSRIGGYLG